MVPPSPARPRRADPVLAWFFVLVWGSGYLASKIGLQYAAPFTFLALRFLFGLVCLLPWLLLSRPRWPRGRAEWFHVGVAGLLMHAVNLGGSHHAQYLGLSAGITALLLATQPLLTALIAHRFMRQRLGGRQWLGVLAALLGVALVVWHKVDVQAVPTGAFAAVLVSLAAITAGTLYQRRYCPQADLRSASFVQLALSAAALTPLAWGLEGFVVRWSWALAGSVLFLVVFASILAVNALHLLMRRGHATQVTSLLFLTPIVAVLLEWALFGVVPTPLGALGIAVTCAGVALVSSNGARPP
ncbi:EamA family transporter [Aquincola sp. MAHUQ-54]|uniref:EamA family transporter n=1 Tax=Aquincola agrisoli TaxID=3119538 RepID=A0AAW9QB37_9BURK